MVIAAVVLVGALAVGQALVSWRAARDAGTGAALVGGPPPSPVVASVTRDQAIALVRGLSSVRRVDRIAAKLVPWSEFEPVGMGVDMTGGPHHGGGLPLPGVWAVAVAGDIYPDGAPIRPLQHYTWSVWGINASRLQLLTLNVGDSGAWPPGFDALADHVAVAPPAPTSSPAPLVFDLLGPGDQPSSLVVRDLAAADGAATDLWAVVVTDRDPTGSVTTALRHSRDGGRTWSGVAGGPSRPWSVAASGGTVLVADPGTPVSDPATGRATGTSSGGGLFRSSDGGSTWVRITTEGVLRVRAFAYAGRRVFLAEHWWATNGAAIGPSRIVASLDGASWREIGEVPGTAQFALLDVPLVWWSKNVPGDGMYRVEGTDLASLRLVAVSGSQRACCTADGCCAIVAGPGGTLWRGGGAQVWRSADGGRTWTDASAGLGGRIAGVFVLRDHMYAVGDGAYLWDGSRWAAVAMRGGKTQGVFPVGDAVILQTLPGHLERSR